MPLPPTAPSVAISTSQQPGKYKKRCITYTEESSEDEDADMDNIEDNDSSGSSVDSDHVPAKRLRTSMIVTRSSRTTPASEEVDVPQLSFSPTDDNSPSLGNPITELEYRIPGADTGAPPSDDCTDLGGATTIHTVPTPRHSPTVDIDIDMNIDESSTASGTGDTAGVRAHNTLDTPRVSPFPPLSPVLKPGSKSDIPDFLTGKNDIYEYLSSTEESAFRDMLKAYITFELANRSPIRGFLPTVRRPKAIAWWSSRARPNKLPPYDSLKSFTSSIVEWWIVLQPHWREIQPGKTSRVGGDWECLHQPGINGFLNVVILAHWWVRILKERGSAIDETYSWFVSDVTWVLSQLTIVAREEDA